MHGFTHQYDAHKNPHSGMSGDDYEFWDAVHSRPIAGETWESISSRVGNGLSEMLSLGFLPFAWETPHYEASPLSYSVFASVFRNTYQRVVYSTAGVSSAQSTSGKRLFWGIRFSPT